MEVLIVLCPSRHHNRPLDEDRTMIRVSVWAMPIQSGVKDGGGFPGMDVQVEANVIPCRHKELRRHMTDKHTH